MRYQLAIAFTALVVATPASAEVADKEPTLGALWALALAFTLATALLAKIRYWLGLIVVPFAALWALGVHFELTDPFVGPDILRELGHTYVALSYLSVTAGLLGPLAIVVWSSRVR